MDLTTLSEEALSDLHRGVVAEKQRRDNLSGIPLQIAELAAQYRSNGGDEAALQDALTPEEQAALNA